MQKGVRRRWFEFNSKAKAYADKSLQKWRKISGNLAHEITRLPRGFTCFHFSKDMPVWDRLRLSLLVEIGKNDGGFEYSMLEVDNGILRKVKTNPQTR